MIKNIIFDVGDVIYFPNREKIIKKSIKLTQINPHMLSKKDSIKHTKGLISNLEIFKKLTIGTNYSPKDYLKIYSKIRSKYSHKDKKISRLVIKLKKTYNIYIISNTNKLHKDIYKKKGAYNGYKDVVLSCDVKMSKPNKNIYSYSIKRFKINPKESIFIDDLKENITTAKKLKIKGIQFKNFKQLKKDLKKYNIKW